MACLICKFCAHSNPEGSTFCNACGSQLNLQPCPRCEAINSESAEQCLQCGAPLYSAATEDLFLLAAAPTQVSRRAESSVWIADPLPTVLAERLDAIPDHRPTPPREPSAGVGDAAVVEGAPEDAAAPSIPGPASPAAAFTGEPAGGDVGAPSGLHGDRAAYPTANSSRRFVLGVLLVAAASGAAYWVYENPVRSTEPQSSSGGQAATAPEPASSSRARTQTRNGPPDSREPPPNAASPPSASSSESPPPMSETASPSPDAQPPAPAQQSETANAPISPKAKTAGSRDAGTHKVTDAPATRAARRQTAAPQPQRTKEQAKRDAIATQRLIARELGDTSHADSKEPLGN